MVELLFLYGEGYELGGLEILHMILDLIVSTHNSYARSEMRRLVEKRWTLKIN